MIFQPGEIAIIKRIDVIVIVLKQRVPRRIADGAYSLQMSYVLGSSGLYWIATSSLSRVNPLQG